MDIIEYLADIGRKGGAAGTGKSKERDADHYKRISALGVAKRLKNKRAKAKLAKRVKKNK